MPSRKTKQAPSPLEAHLGFWLRFVSNHVSIRFQQLLEDKCVTVTEWVALRTLWSQRDTTHAELIDALGMNAAFFVMAGLSAVTAWITRRYL